MRLNGARSGQAEFELLRTPCREISPPPVAIGGSFSGRAVPNAELAASEDARPCHGDVGLGPGGGVADRRPRALSLGYHETARDLLRLAVCGGQGQGSQAGAVLGQDMSGPSTALVATAAGGRELVVGHTYRPHDCYDNNLVFAIDPANKQIWDCARGADSHQKPSSLSATRTPKCKSSSYRP